MDCGEASAEGEIEVQGSEDREMTRPDGRELTEQGAKIVAAIELGMSRMTPIRWDEEAEKNKWYDDTGEWFASEFAESREATVGISWDFDSWENALDYIMNGTGTLGGVSLLVALDTCDLCGTETRNLSYVGRDGLDFICEHCK